MLVDCVALCGGQILKRILPVSVTRDIVRDRLLDFADCYYASSTKMAPGSL